MAVLGLVALVVLEMLVMLVMLVMPVTFLMRLMSQLWLFGVPEMCFLSLVGSSHGPEHRFPRHFG